MEIETAISRIRRQRQAFAYGIEGIQTLFLEGPPEGEAMQPLRTKVIDDLTFSAWLLPEDRQMNVPMKQATANQLAMQLIVGVANTVSNTPYAPEGENYADHDSPTIRFLRLVRNGVAHGNKVNYNNSDPRPNTEWRGMKFTSDMEYDILFSELAEFTWQTEKVDMFDGHMEAGDAFVLTRDVLAELIDESDEYDGENIIGLSEWG